MYKISSVKPTSTVFRQVASAAVKGSRSVLLALLLTAIAAFGQGIETGTISGTVKDATGAVIAGARVTVKSLATGIERTATTGGIGQYQIQSLTPGNYQVTISGEKFETYRTTAEVTVGGISTVDVQMTVGQSSAVIEVVGGAATEVNTQTQELSQLVNTQQVASLPSLTRNVYDFVALSGNVSGGDNSTNQGATIMSNSGQNNLAQGVGYSINGQREAGTEILLDGVENINIFSAVVGEQVPVDAVQEYSVITNNFGAEYGRASGGVVNVTTKSGSNDFHGSVWEFNRLSAYTANTYNNVANDVPKGTYTRNMFGFNVGGPLVKNKLFFSMTTEWTRVRSDAVQSELIPCDASCPGASSTNNFLSYTAANVQNYFAAYGAHLPVATSYNQAALGISLPGIPAAAPILGQVNFPAASDAGGGLPTNTYEILGRVDFNLSNKTQMFARFAQENGLFFSGTYFYSPYPQYDAGTAVNNDSGLFSVTHTFSSTLLSNSKVSITRLVNPVSYQASQQNVPELLFQANVPASVGVPVTFPGLVNIMSSDGSGGLPSGGPQNTVQLEQDVSWTKGKHSMRFGGQFTYLQTNVAYGAYAQADEVLPPTVGSALTAMDSAANCTSGTCGGGGTLAFYEAAINPQGTLPCPTYFDGNSINPANCTITTPVSSPSFSRSYRYRDWAVYAQDSFRAAPRLTLNYGLRYEHYGVQHNSNQALDSNLYYGPGSNIYQQVATGTVQLATQSPIGQLWAPRWGTAAPRVGFAYDVFGNGDTSLRGGYGISYERNYGNVTYNMIQNPPAYAVVEDFGVPVTNSNLGPFASPGLSIPLSPVELRNVNEHINVAQTQFWSLAVEHKLARNTLVAVEYSGAHGVHLYDILVGNPAGGAQEFFGAPFYTGTDPTDTAPGDNNACSSYTDPATGVPACYSRPNSSYAGVNVRGSNGESSYNSLNLKFQTENLHNTGLSLVSNFTWSHTLDDLSQTFAADSNPDNLGYLDPLNPKLDWGSADYNVGKRLVVAPIWETPWFKSGKGLGEALGGWTATGILTARTGVPFTAYDNTYNIGQYSGVPRILPSAPITSHKATGGPAIGPNEFLLNTIPGANDLAPYNTTLGIDDFGPFPAGMLSRGSFDGPGAWNLDASVGKKFKFTERFGLEFRAEGFDVFNHHDLFALSGILEETGTPGTIGPPTQIIGLKGGLNTFAAGGNHDERRFGQFSLRLTF